MMTLNRYDRISVKIALTMLSATVIIFVLMSLEFGTGNAGIPEEQAFYTMARNRFAAASRGDLLYIWHHDCHRRCFYQIEEHFEISCTYDPYISARPRRSLTDIMNRTHKITPHQTKSNSTETALALVKSAPSGTTPFLSNQAAKSFLRTKRSGEPLQRNRRGIMHECCFTKACSWEEYAEYCHRTRRTEAAMENNCSYS